MGQVHIVAGSSLKYHYDHLVESSANPSSVQRGTYSSGTGYCRVPPGLLWGDRAYSESALKVVSGEGHLAQSVWIGAN